MSEYVVQLLQIDVYNVHKMSENSPIPESTYKVVWNKKPHCNCLSGTYRGYCKHIDFVREYRRKLACGDNNIKIAFFNG